MFDHVPPVDLAIDFAAARVDVVARPGPSLDADAGPLAATLVFPPSRAEMTLRTGVDYTADMRGEMHPRKRPYCIVII